MFLEVAADSSGAIALYEGAGFARVGARPGYYARGNNAVDALVMRRDLNSRPC
jgi:[ribosomal protein S18]-alanine N-acetyltransferase